MKTNIIDVKIIKRKLLRLLIILTDTRWWFFFIQRRFRQPRLRRLLSSMITVIRPPIQNSNSESLKHVDALMNAGNSNLGVLLTTNQCDELIKYFSRLLVFDDYHPEIPPFLPSSDARHPESHIALHNARDVVLAPYLLQLANSPLILEIAAGFLGCKPTLSYITAWWSYPTECGAQQAEHFHRDFDDWRFLKLFVYLTDVEENNGPHIYVRHSADDSMLREIRRFKDTEVLSIYGQKNLQQLVSHAGQGFLENTIGIHKGQPVKEGRRLVFQAMYCMLPIPYGPKYPVVKRTEVQNHNSFELDAWVNRVYLAS